MVAMFAIARQLCLVDTQRERFTGTHTFRWQYSKDASGSGSDDCAWVDYVRWSPTGGGGGGGGNLLDEAVDSTLEYTTGGADDWFDTSARYYYDGDSAQSGDDVDDSEESWMQTTVEGEGTLTFYWRVSSETNYDFLEFYLDSTLQSGRISGSTDWAQKSYDITGSGTHTLKWRYVKDGSESSGYDCGWVDYVQWSGTTQNPLPTEWTTITYTYDPAGRRIEKAYDGTTVMKYLYDGDHIIAEYDGFTNLLHKYIYGPGVDQPICMIDVNDSNAVYYYHFDGLGSVIALTNSSGSVVNLYEYSVYGEVSASDPNHPNRFLFTGREFDKDTGLYYYRARYYNPYIGRFLQTDPIGYGDGMGWYSYCDNNPVCSADPSGLRTAPVGPQFFLRDKTGANGQTWKEGYWERGPGFPALSPPNYWGPSKNNGDFDETECMPIYDTSGAYFRQTYANSCAAVAILNVWLTVGRQLPTSYYCNGQTKALDSDPRAEEYVCGLLEADGAKPDPRTGWNSFGIWPDKDGGLGCISKVLGRVNAGHWAVQEKLATAEAITAKISETGKPVIVAVNVNGNQHAITIIKTPDSLVQHLKEVYRGKDEDYAWSVISGDSMSPGWGSEVGLKEYLSEYKPSGWIAW